MNKVKSYIRLCSRLIGLIDNLKMKMIMAITMGSIGHIMASIIPTLGAFGLAKLIDDSSYNYKNLVYIILILAVVRSLLRYLEQLFNHDVAFTNKRQNI